MRLLIVGLAVLAVVVAGLSTYLINTFYSEERLQKLEQLSRPKIVRVLVAARDIRPGDAISPGNVVWQVWGAENVNPKFLSVTEPADSTAESSKRMESYRGQIARIAFVPGEPITSGKLFQQKGSNLMSGILDGGKRAIAIPVKPENAVGGFVLPGDFVDVLLTHKLAGQVEKDRRRGQSRNSASSTQNLTVVTYTTETIVSNVRVVAVDQTYDDPTNKAVVGKSVTLEVSPKQAEVITTGKEMGKLSLVLRSLGGGDENGRKAYTTDVDVSPLLSKLSGRGSADSEKARSADSRTIRIYRGGQSSTQEVGVK